MAQSLMLHNFRFSAKNVDTPASSLIPASFCGTITPKNICSKSATPAFTFVVLMGIVSLFADMTYEGARSIYGVYLPLLGASAAAVGFVTGLGEFVGHALRLITGIIAAKTKNYWGMTLLGYGVNAVAIPLLALVPENGWILACMLIICERTGKAIRQPAKNTMLSFAATQLSVGRTFALQEFLDQLGAFCGPLILFAVLWLKDGDNLLTGYTICFAVLAVPAALAMLFLLLARSRFPSPECFEKKKESETSFTAKADFIIYLAAVIFFALGFMDFPLITLHASKLDLLPSSQLPLLYAGAMIVDAFAALFFGRLYDRIHFMTLAIAGLTAAFFAVFVFSANSFWGIVVGAILWGIGMGAQESILKAAVVHLTARDNRSVAFGIFESCLGISWFLGSWFMGWLYDLHPTWLVIFSVSTQLLAIPLYILLYFRMGTKKIDGADNA